MEDLSLKVATTTLNINVINTPLKRPRLSKWIKIHHPTVCWLYKTHSNIMTQLY